VAGRQEAEPEVTRSIGYVADGGPRIVLVLNPPLPSAQMAYFTVSVASKDDLVGSSSAPETT